MCTSNHYIYVCWLVCHGSSSLHMEQIHECWDFILSISISMWQMTVRNTLYACLEIMSKICNFTFTKYIKAKVNWDVLFACMMSTILVNHQSKIKTRKINWLTVTAFLSKIDLSAPQLIILSLLSRSVNRTAVMEDEWSPSVCTKP